MKKKSTGVFAALAEFFGAVAADESAGEPKAACGTCGADGCDCGDGCTAKGCGCCDACKATGESGGEGGSASGGGDSGATGDAAASAEVQRLKAELAAEKARSAALASGAAAAEKARNDGIAAKVSAFLEKNGAKFGKDGREAFAHLYRGVLLGAISTRTAKAGFAGDKPESERFDFGAAVSLSAEQSAVLAANLEQIVAVMPVLGQQARIEAGGQQIDALAREAASGDVDLGAIHRKALDALRAEGITDRDPKFADAYAVKRAALLKEAGYGS